MNVVVSPWLVEKLVTLIPPGPSRTNPDGVIVIVPTPLLKFGALAVTVAVPVAASACTKIPVIVVEPSGMVTPKDPDPVTSK